MLARVRDHSLILRNRQEPATVPDRPGDPRSADVGLDLVDVLEHVNRIHSGSKSGWPDCAFLRSPFATANLGGPDIIFRLKSEFLQMPASALPHVVHGVEPRAWQLTVEKQDRGRWCCRLTGKRALCGQSRSTGRGLVRRRPIRPVCKHCNSSAGGLPPRRGIIQQIKASGIDFVISVPDITTSEGLLRPLAKLSRSAAHPRLQGGRRRRHLRRPVLHRQARAVADPADRPARFHQRGARRAVEYKLPICMMVGLLRKGARRAAAAIQALRRAHRRADPRRHGHRLSQDRGQTPTWRKSARRSTRRLRRIAARRSPDRTEADMMDRKKTPHGDRAPRHRRRHRAAGLFDRVRLDRHPAEPAQLSVARRDGARLVARARALRSAGPTSA